MKRKNTREDIMSKEIILRKTPSSSSISSVDRRKPLLDGHSSSSKETEQPTSCSCGTRFSEVVGGTTADCAAVCCCCPCGLFNLIVMAIYKLPAGLYRKALRKKRRRRLIKNGINLQSSDRSCICDEPEFLFWSTSTTPMSMVNAVHADEDVLALEEEMWGKFYSSSGFWRSPSQRSDVMHG